MAEGLLFEPIWMGISASKDEFSTLSSKISLGVVTSYALYVSGYVITQVLTPVFSSAGFFLDNLLVFIPNILASGLLAAVIGGAVAPVLFYFQDVKIAAVKGKAYYPLTIGISLFCWVVVVINSLLIAS